LRLLTLPDEIQASLARGEITAGHARALLGIDDAAEQRRAWRRIVEGNLSVRDAEALSKGIVKAGPRSRRPLAPDLAAVEERLRATLGTRVDLQKGRKGGRLVVHFFSEEELNAIVDRLG
jgi:ParB family chromosome partitioning protein